MTNKKKIAALLPLKANSERIPGKNFKNIAGKPLFRWMLDTLLAVPEIDSVIINTDATDQLLLAGLDDSQVLLRERPAELCGDFVSMNDIIRNDIDNSDFDIYLMTHVTNPLISTETVYKAISAFHKQDASSLFSVNRFQTRFYSKDGSPINHDPENLIRTQDLEPWYEENSCIYLFTRDSFFKHNARIGSNPIMFETPKFESADIDEPEDWMIAEALLRRLPTDGI